jgi:hypothetical protein
VNGGGKVFFGFGFEFVFAPGAAEEIVRVVVADEVSLRPGFFGIGRHPADGIACGVIFHSG